MEPHIAVLVLDTPIESITDEFGDFGDNAVELLKASKVPLKKYQIAYDLADPLQQTVTDLNFSDLLDGIDQGLIKGLVLSGSRSDSFNNENPWIQLTDKFLKSIITNRPGFPMVGLCFGHQILAKNLGCKVNRNTTENGWECGITTIALNKSILSVEKSPFADTLETEDGNVLDHINLVEFHRDVVYGLPPTSTSNSLLSQTNFQSIGSTNKCSIQGLVTESGPVKILTFQGHPEFSTPETLKLLQLTHEIGKIDKATFDRLSYKTNNLINHGTVVANVILKFLETHS
ncbi:hypothetical protein C7M61_002467 [Candidozyma pseudohaemuli]|uniref:Glutamine amidotransferase domain-containing protein n=1 Tax=Candidozyma pseudohaemuli TaxID=418784 RepID=A0A2P7YRG7_9ASCO|nr:hypothetical protein C7M61_002467 [[Candida] pseudohaemulonii]PSK38534.1 hypothetical protein C7M61_002467 [[Candida] pseudohaemulonii]